MNTDTKTTAAPAAESSEKKEKAPSILAGFDLPHGNGHISHVHIGKDKNNPDVSRLFAKLDGKNLFCPVVSKEDLEAYSRKELSSAKLIETYHAGLMYPKVAPYDKENLGSVPLNDREAKIDTCAVFTNQKADHPDFGKQIIYAQVEGQKWIGVLTPDLASRYFHRTIRLNDLLVAACGEKKNLKAYYEQFHLPENAQVNKISVSFKQGEKTNYISAELPNGKTSRVAISSYDSYSLRQAKTATKEQLAAKYLNNQILEISQRPARRQEQQQAVSAKRTI